MTKKKNLYVMDTETGKYEPLEAIGDIHAEQLTLDLDEPAPKIDDFECELDAVVDLDMDQMRELIGNGWIVDIDDTYNELIKTLDKLHDEYLNGIYYATKADNLEEIKRISKIMQSTEKSLFMKAFMLLEIYCGSCHNEYVRERDDALAAFTPEKMN